LFPIFSPKKKHFGGRGVPLGGGAGGGVSFHSESDLEKTTALSAPVHTDTGASSSSAGRAPTAAAAAACNGVAEELQRRWR